MQPPTYSQKQTAELLGVPAKALSPFKQDAFSAAELWGLRGKLQRFPPPIGERKQLFLNFKGGTGKTSLSTSYAYRLAELGYRVLLVDLDSQGHATKCLGYEGEDFQRTLLDVLVRKTPIGEVIQKTPVPN
ncbi:MAG TPA: AAA family ATPase, partial [Myxococcales bacterium]|nr:AAA family ATPase [Myxococcales bacterium]